jgi:hypothetical protein
LPSGVIDLAADLGSLRDAGCLWVAAPSDSIRVLEEVVVAPVCKVVLARNLAR